MLLWLRLLKLTRQFELELREGMRLSFSSTLPQFDVLASLHRNPGGIRMKELSGDLVMSNGNLTSIVDKLHTDGLVRRESDPEDRRAMLVSLTDLGLLVFLEQAAVHSGWISNLMASLSEQDALAFERKMADLAKASAGRAIPPKA